ncbi:unnamed protein product [Rotaria sp. Silwood1]|nr:unnamed protein product [Rotaria sp. Silwood1]
MTTTCTYKSICLFSYSSRLTTSPESPADDKFNVLPDGPGSSSSSTSISSVLLPLYCSQCQQPIFAPNHPTNIPYICSNYLTSTTRHHSVLTTKPCISTRSSELLLLATYFDIRILHTLFNPSWLTDSYLWCLEYLHKRIIDISDEILSDTLMNGTLPINILRFKITNDIIEQQCMMVGIGDISASTSIKQPTHLLNKKLKKHKVQSVYINRNSTINFGVVLAGIHAVICKEHHLKVCELVMNMLDVLLGLAVISSTEDGMHKKQLLTIGNTGTTSDDEQIEQWLKQIDAKEEKFQLAVDITLRLGCSHCQLRGRSFIADQLRRKVHLPLNKLRLLNQQRFEKYFLNLTHHGDLVHILDIFHALCVPTKSDTQLQQTYSNNFSNTHLGVGPKSIDGFILNIIFKPFVTPLIMMKKYLMSSENVALYCECRAFLTCIKENHGEIFRVVAFSSLLDPEKNLKHCCGRK